MGKFCIYCGKELEEGKTCDCAQAQGTTETATQDFTAASVGQDIGSTFKSLLTIVNKPGETLKSFIDGANFIVALILIGAQAVFSTLFTLVLCFDLGSELPKVLVEVFFFSILLSGVLYGSLFLLTAIFKGKTDPKKLLCVVAVRSTIVIPFVVLGLLVGIVSMGLGVGLFIIAEVFAFGYVYLAMKTATGLEDTKMIFVVPIAIVVVLIAFYLIAQGVAKDVITGLLFSGLSGLGGLSNLY